MYRKPKILRNRVYRLWALLTLASDPDIAPDRKENLSHEIVDSWEDLSGEVDELRLTVVPGGLLDTADIYCGETALDHYLKTKPAREWLDALVSVAAEYEVPVSVTWPEPPETCDTCGQPLTGGGS